jgi:ATP-dependent protease ClpP protease subunit
MTRAYGVTDPRSGVATELAARRPTSGASGHPPDRAVSPAGVPAGLQRRPADRLVAITGQSRALVARDVERGRMLTAEEAVACGLVDKDSARTAR